MFEQVYYGVSNIVLPLPNPPLIKGRGLDFLLSSLSNATVYTQVKLPPLIPPMYLGETGKISSLPFTRGGLGWGNLRNNSDLIAKRSVGITCVYTVAFQWGTKGVKSYLKF